jgi:hypothetical protein
LIGDWFLPRGDIDDNGAYTAKGGFDVTTLNADHTFSQVSHPADLPPAHVLSGDWHMEGQQLVLKFTWAHPSMQDMVGEELRLIISHLHSDRFVSANAQNQKQKMVWTRVKQSHTSDLTNL